MTILETPTQPIEQRLRAAYYKARAVDGLWQHVDPIWQVFNAKLGRIQNGPALVADRTAAATELCETMLADLTRWAANPYELLRPSASAPQPPPHIIARDLIVEWRRKGIVLTADADGRLTAYPAGKLDKFDKQRLGQFKEAIVTEINREVYFVP